MGAPVGRVAEERGGRRRVSTAPYNPAQPHDPCAGREGVGGFHGHGAGSGLTAPRPLRRDKPRFRAGKLWRVPPLLHPLDPNRDPARPRWHELPGADRLSRG